MSAVTVEPPRRATAAARRPPRKKRRASGGPGSSCPPTRSLVILYLIDPDRRDDRVRVQHTCAAARTSSGSSLRTLDAWQNCPRFPDLTTALKLSLEVAILATIVADDPGDAARPRARPVPVPGRGDHELRDLPGDRVARDRAGVVAADDVRATRPASRRDSYDDPARPHHVLHRVRRDHGARARRRAWIGRLEEAAQDLGATPLTTFFKVTLAADPARRSIAGVLLAFALSIDDFVITNFVAGPDERRSRLWVFGADETWASRRR